MIAGVGERRVLRRREYRLPITRELYPAWHPLAGREIDASASAAAAVPRVRRPSSRAAAPPRP
jgi:hypothetical protein